MKKTKHVYPTNRAVASHSVLDMAAHVCWAISAIQRDATFCSCSQWLNHYSKLRMRRNTPSKHTSSYNMEKYCAQFNIRYLTV